MARRKKLTKVPTRGKPDVGDILGGVGSSASGAGHSVGGGGKGYTPPDVGGAVSSAGSSASGTGSAVGGSSTGSAGAGVGAVTGAVAHQTGVKAAPPYQPPAPLTNAITSVLPNLNPAEMLFAPLAVQAGARYNVSPALLMGVIKQESGFDPEAVGPITAEGVAKGSTGFLSSTAKKYGVEFGKTPKAVASQVMGAAKYLSELDVNNDTKRALDQYGVGGGKAYTKPVEKAAKQYGPLDRLAVEAAKKFANSPHHDTAPASKNYQSAGAALASAGRQGEGQGQKVGQKQSLRQEALASYRSPQGKVGSAFDLAGAAGRRTAGAQGAPINSDTVPASQNTQRPPGQAGRNGRPTALLEDPNARAIAKKLVRKVKKAGPGSLKQYADLGPAAPQLAAAAIKYGKEFNIDPSFLMAIAEIETGFGAAAGSGTAGAGAVSRAGAQGYMQFIPESRDTVLKATGYDAFSKDPAEAMAAAAGYFSVFAPDAQSNWDRAFSYNHADWYADDVTANAEKYKELDNVAVGAAGGKQVPKQLIQTAKQEIGKAATRAILNGGKLVKAPEGAKVKGGTPKSAADEIEMGLIKKATPKQLKYFSIADSLDHAWFDPVLLKALIGVAKETGEPITLNSGFRTREEQEAAYADFQNGGVTAAVPGSSNHEYGLAADISLTPAQTAVLGKYGLSNQVVSGEPWHVEVVDEGLKSQQTAVNLGSDAAPEDVGPTGIKVKGTNLMVVSPVEPTASSTSGGTYSSSGAGGVASTAPGDLAGAVDAARKARSGISPFYNVSTSPIAAFAPSPQVADPRSLLSQESEDPIARAFNSAFRPSRRR